MRRPSTLLFRLTLLAVLTVAPAAGKKAPPAEGGAGNTDEAPELLAGLAFRELGPALASGRVADLAVHPGRTSTWYAAIASGGVWRTDNAGTTWRPLFDDQGSYSIGSITLDPNDPLVVWVGTGENNSQRSVSYGDGVYKSTDGGAGWTNVGLKESEHIGRIVVDPRDSRVVYVAAQGPLWRAGGDRGLFKTTDGGGTWKNVLEISQHTGVNEVWIDPRDPDVLYASAYQRARRTWTLIDGGPESAIYKSTDAGANWQKLTAGLPTEEMGKIGLAVSPAAPDVVYAIVESIDDAGGVFRSTDAGANWEKRSDYVSDSPQYYNELVPDPHDPDRVYSMDTWLHVSEDGGKTFVKVPETSKHVDNHALWIDPANTDHLVAGCDGGVYETWDRGATWQFKANLPVTQFYKIAVDDDEPFYNVYGGTQDNSTLGGPSRTTSEHGITNRDWYVTVGGDGFKPAVEPGNPDVVYAQWQYGNLVRYDRKSGELIDIQPQPEPGDDPPRFNWDSAFILSPHSPTRLYFAAQRIYRSDDRGDSWRPVSPDLTRQLDRNQLEVMGKLWSIDAVAKNRSTSFYGNLVSLAESPLVEGLLYAGSDDGLIQVSEDGGASWRRVERFPGVPEMSYVADLEASLHDPDTVYAAFDNHKSGDFKPYLLVSRDRGRSWASIAGDLPERGSVLTVVEDHVKPQLLFAGTEFGVFATLDGGGAWLPLGGGLPVIAVRDLVIQRREDDLVAGTFGRGIYVLDDYSPLRALDPAALEQPALLFPPRRTWMYMKSYELGYNGKAFQGDAFYSAPNPAPGALITYRLGAVLESPKKQRRAAEKAAEEAGERIRIPSWEELRAEDRAEDPVVVLTVRDAAGQVVRRLTGPVEEGLHRVTWDLRYPPSSPVELEPPPRNAFTSDPIGPMVVPGEYTVSLARWQDNRLTELAGPVAFETVPIGTVGLATDDRQALLAFQRQTAALQRAVMGSVEALGEVQVRIDHLRRAALDTAPGEVDWLARIETLEGRFEDLRNELEGDSTIASRSEPTPPSIVDRLGRVIGGHWTSSSAPTATHRRAYQIAADAFAPVLAELRRLVDEELAALEAEMDAAGAPWTPGRLPNWRPE